MTKAPVIDLHENRPFVGQLQDELNAVIAQEKFGELSVAELVGVLEFVKFNLINRSE